MQKFNDIMAMLKTQFADIVRHDRRNIFFLLYYSVIEGVLLMVSPLTSAFIINSVLAHATVSIVALAVVVIVIFLMIAALQIIKEYIIEKFEQKIFVRNSIKVAELALGKGSKPATPDKYMNYFFDVLSIQKVFPVLLLNGSSLVIKIVISMILLMIFDVAFFWLGLFFILFFVTTVLLLGKRGPDLAIRRSDAKHEAIYFLQKLPRLEGEAEEKLHALDRRLEAFVKARRAMFGVVSKQLSLTFFLEGLVLATFFIVGGYLVFRGSVPIGEFVAVEIVVISLVGALRDFMKQVDYMYDMIEGFYKVDKLQRTLEAS